MSNSKKAVDGNVRREFATEPTIHPHHAYSCSRSSSDESSAISQQFPNRSSIDPVR